VSNPPNHNPFAQAAHEYAERGWHVIELYRMDPSGKHCTCGKECGGSAGKHPRNTSWQKSKALSHKDIDRLWKPENVYNANLGIATGDPSGFWVLDVDPDGGGVETLQKMQAKHGRLAPARAVRTGSGGWHLYFAMPDFPVTNSRGRIARKFGKGVDVRGTGGQVVAPPSRSGKGDYSVLKDGPLTQAPDWLLDLIRPENPPNGEPPWTPETSGPSSSAPAASSTPGSSTEAPSASAAANTAAAPSPQQVDPRMKTYAERAWNGELARLDEMKAKGWDGPPWDSTTYEVACNLIELAQAAWTPYDVNAAYHALFTRAPRDPGFDDVRVNAKFESARQRVGSGARSAPVLTTALAPDEDIAGSDATVDPRLLGGAMPAGAAPIDSTWPKRTWDDIGNAQRMYDRHGGTLRWIAERKMWARYTGHRWELVEDYPVRSMVHEMLDSLAKTEALAFSPAIEDGKKISDRTAFMKWVATQRMSSKITACLKETQAIQTMQASMADFDRDPMLLNVANGVVDLRTGALVPPSPEQMMLQASPVAYDPEARSPLWDKFLERTQPDPEMRAYLQRVSGYSLTGSMASQAFFIHHGTGANGKSVYLRAASTVTGDYGQTVPRSTLLVKQNEQHPEAVARMMGKRFLQVSETAPGRRLDEEIIKGLTGGEKQTARFMFAGSFDFTPTGKIHYVTNHRPRVSDAHSIWRRLHLIDWGVTIPDEEIDPDLGDKLDGEAQGILTWMVAGAVEWNRRGRLDEPASVKADIEEYRVDQDDFGEFISTSLIIDPSALTSLTNLYQAYTGWCFNMGIRNYMQGTDFGKALAERGYERHRTGSRRGFRGLRVGTSEQPTEHPVAPRVEVKDDTTVDAFFDGVRF
jgi:putative DNA primase/helicase